MTPPDTDEIVEDLLGLYRSPAGSTLYDEHVTETEHALQCADLALDAGASDHLVVAALFHDIGHLLAGGAAVASGPVATDDRHELRGARHLRRHFGPEVAAPVANHVDAKRYLVAVDPDHLAGLSPASVQSLELQGGAFPQECLDAVARRPRWDDAVLLRRWDDAAKVPGRSTRTLDDHTGRIIGVLRR